MSESMSEADLPFWMGLGVQFLVLGSDAAFVFRSSRRALERARGSASGAGG
jgi:hypothetical protein